MASIPVIPGVKVTTKGILNKPIKDIICAILFGGIDNMLKGNLLCIEANLNEILEDQGLANLTDLKDALKELRDEVKAFQDHLGVGEVLKRVNGAVADLQKMLSLGGMCPVPMKAPQIPDILGQVTNSMFGAANSILSDLGRLAKPQLCLDAQGGINTGSYKPDSILGTLSRKLGKLDEIPSNQIEQFTNRIKGVSKAIKKQINRELFPDFRHKHNLRTGKTYVPGEPATAYAATPPAAALAAMEVSASEYPPPDSPRMADAIEQAQKIVSSVNQTASYPVKVDGITHENIWPATLGPELYALAIQALTPADPTFVRQEPVYDYCGRLVGYEENVVSGDRSADGGDPFEGADANPPDVNFTILWVNGIDEDPTRIGWAVEGNVSEQLIGPVGAKKKTTALNLNPEITLYRGRSHLFSLPPGQQQEFYIYEVLLGSAGTDGIRRPLLDNNGKPTIIGSFNKGLSRFETNEFLAEANGRDESNTPWIDTSLPEEERNTGPEPEAWKRNDLFPNGMTLMVTVGGGSVDADGFFIEDVWPDYIAYGNKNQTQIGLIKLI